MTLTSHPARAALLPLARQKPRHEPAAFSTGARHRTRVEPKTAFAGTLGPHSKGTQRGLLVGYNPQHGGQLGHPCQLAHHLCIESLGSTLQEHEGAVVAHYCTLYVECLECA